MDGKYDFYIYFYVIILLKDLLIVIISIFFRFKINRNIKFLNKGFFIGYLVNEINFFMVYKVFFIL